MLGGDRIDHRQHGIGLADARGMEPHKEAGWARHARLAVTLRPARRLLLADPGAPGKQQRRDRRGIARQRAIGTKREGRLGGILDLYGWQQRIGGPGKFVGARGRLIEAAFDGDAGRLERGRIGVLRHPYRIADHDAKLGEGQVDGKCAPIVEREVAIRRHGAGHDRAPRELRQHDDAVPSLARRARSDVGGHGHGRALLKRLKRFPKRGCPAAIPAPVAGAGASDQSHAEAA